MLGQTVAACLIARDEAAHIGECLASLDGQVDEVVLVDTGSSDDTIAIAERHGARVLRLPWRDDFALARNHGLEHARADWALYIDADERLCCPEGRRLADLLPRTGAVAARLRFRPMLDATPYAEYRLFRIDPRIRFTGSMHESVLPALERVAAQDGLAIVDLFDVQIVHHGYEGDLARKHARNLPLLRRSLVEDPRRVYLHYHLGATLRLLGRADEARRHLAEGLRLGEASDRLQARVEGSTCAQLLAEIELGAGAAGRALVTVDRGLALFGENLALRLTRARCLLALRQAADALEIAEAIAALDPAGFFDHRIAYETSLFEVDCREVMGAAELQLGAYARAERHYLAAAAAARDPMEYSVKARYARARADGAVQAWTT